MDSPTDVSDLIIDNLIDCGAICDDDRINVFLPEYKKIFLIIL